MSTDDEITEICNALAQVIKQHREKKGYSMNRLAQKAGLAVQAVSFVEKSLRKPNIETIIRLAHALETSPSALLTEAEQKIRS